MSTTSKSSSKKQESTTNRLASVAHNAIDSAANKASEVEATLREGTQEAKAKAKSAARDVKAKGSDMASNVMNYVDQNPGKSVGIAFLAGLIASKLLRR